MKHQNRDPMELREQDTYQTGSTTPPKSHNGLIALLLVTIIFLAGIISILSILNIRLFSALAARNDHTIPLALYADTQDPAATADLAEEFSQTEEPCIGIHGEPVSALCQRFYDLPSGLYITRIAAGSDAEAQGLKQGDILISLNGISVTNSDELSAVLVECGDGNCLEAVVYRDRHTFRATLTVEFDKP